MGRPGALRWALLSAIAGAVLAACGGGDQVISLDAAMFQQAYDQLGISIERAEAGDIDGAEEAYAQALPLFVKVDVGLSALPQEVITLGKLAEVRTRMNQELKQRRRPDVFAEIAEVARRVLVEAAEVLGIEQPQEQ